MHIVLFTHPSFLPSQSMPRFAAMLSGGMSERGHHVEVWTAKPLLFKVKAPGSIRKWLGYFDQFVAFPLQVRLRLRKVPSKTLFVFADQALGPWVPLAADRPHAIHCHDFLAQRSALGTISENPTGFSGRLYQAFIRRGYQKGRMFISVSEKTREDLAEFMEAPPALSEVVYNGLNPAFEPRNSEAARAELAEVTRLDISKGYLLHVGANQWYKNRRGVVEIYNAWRRSGADPLPLLLVGPSASDSLRKTCAASPYQSDIHLLGGLDDAAVRAAYAGATVFLFPSLAEGFGWPIAEAMASGCPVITTAEAPMTEVAGEAAFIIKRRPSNPESAHEWAEDAAKVLEEVLTLDLSVRNEVIARGLRNAARFDSARALDCIEAIYQKIVDES